MVQNSQKKNNTKRKLLKRQKISNKNKISKKYKISRRHKLFTRKKRHKKMYGGNIMCRAEDLVTNFVNSGLGYSKVDNC